MIFLILIGTCFRKVNPAFAGFEYCWYFVLMGLVYGNQSDAFHQGFSFV